MSFYRTYRPQVIEEIDNSHVREQVTSLLKKDRKELPHAFLLTGPKGSGKTTTARILAKLYNCTNYSKKTGPCGTCDQCRSIASGTNMDILELDAASNRGIDEIRELRDRIALAPASGTYKVYIIDEVHMLTTEAFNALLKTLEEPPKHAIFLLATTDPQKIPATIQSRCITIAFRKAKEDELLRALHKIVAKEHVDIDGAALQFIARTSDGAFRDAVKLLEQVSFSAKKVTIGDITELLASSDDVLRSTFLRALCSRNENEALAIIASFVEEGRDIRRFTADVLRDVQRILVVLSTTGSDAMGWELAPCRQLASLFISSYGQMKVSPIAELPLELAVMEFCASALKTEEAPKAEQENTLPAENDDTGVLTIEKMHECWKDVIEAVKPFNHSIAGVLRSAQPKNISKKTLTIETRYAFHKERLSDPKVRDILSAVMKKLFGTKLSVEIVQSPKQ